MPWKAKARFGKYYYITSLHCFTKYCLFAIFTLARCNMQSLNANYEAHSSLRIKAFGNTEQSYVEINGVKITIRE